MPCCCSESCIDQSVNSQSEQAPSGKSLQFWSISSMPPTSTGTIKGKPLSCFRIPVTTLVQTPFYCFVLIAYPHRKVLLHFSLPIHQVMQGNMPRVTPAFLILRGRLDWRTMVQIYPVCFIAEGYLNMDHPGLTPESCILDLAKIC